MKDYQKAVKEVKQKEPEITEESVQLDIDFSSQLEFGSLIKLVLKALKQIQGQVYVGKGCFKEFYCKFNPPAAMGEIRQFELKYDCVIPKDYLAFLLHTNGMQFYKEDDFTFYSIQELIETLEMMRKTNGGYKQGIYPIGYVLGYYIVLKSDEIASGNYVYVGDARYRDEYFSLHCNFETFFERYIKVKAVNYWRWQRPIKKFDFLL